MSYYRQGPYRPGGVSIGVPGLTPCVRVLLIVTASIWVAQFALDRIAGPGATVTVLRLFGVSPAGVMSLMVWQPLSYIFLHDPRDPFHLVFNMLMLWMFGGELERFWGSRAFLRYYLIAGAGGGVAAVLLGLLFGDWTAPTIGASGALFGVFVAYGMLFGDRVILFMMLFPMRARTMAWIMIGLNFFYLLSRPAGSGVSYIAHLGGALTGFLYLKRVWRVGELSRELRWRIKRRRFRVMPPRDSDDRWLN